ncbi:MAG TPA: tail fiber protein [Anaerolineales bacterium]|nr:tail fiber protein [Anaerolineales bacterium]
MSNPYVGEIRIFGGNFAPQGWAFCNGAQVPISENETLFNLIGTTYGGDGQSAFNLPDLQGRVPIHMGANSGGNFVIAQKAGEEQVTLTTNQIPVHNHPPQANTSGSGTSPANSLWAGDPDLAQFAPPASINGQMNALTALSSGGSQPHDNMIPFLAISFIISLFGIFPTRS